MSAGPVYDKIGLGYARQRRPDPRIATYLTATLGGALSVLNVGATMAVLTLHHWADRAGGLAECARVTRERVVLLTWDPAADGFWLLQEYFPEFIEADRRQFPSIPAYAEAFGPSARVRVSAVPVPRDCVDGFLGAYWARPEAYLDPAVRAGISSFALPGTETGLERLRADLASGAWHARHGLLLAEDALDLGSSHGVRGQPASLKSMPPQSSKR